MNIELSQDLQDLFETVREDCSSSLWSAAVELTRRAEFHEHAILDDEQQYLVLHSGDVISPKVILWPTDLNWACSCASSDDPCLHTAAVLIAIKSKRVITAASGSTSGLNRIEYRFQAEQQGLSLTRWIVGDSTEQKLTDSLTSTIAGIESGRIPLQPISAASEDLTVDELLSEQRNNLLPHVALLAVFRCLASLSLIHI